MLRYLTMDIDRDPHAKRRLRRRGMRLQPEARGNKIIVSAEPRGRFLEGTIVGTPVPGTCMLVTAATNPTSGRFSYTAFTQSTGSEGQVNILLGDEMQGFVEIGSYANFTPSGGVGGSAYNAPGTVYVSGVRGFLYSPIMGEEFNMCVKNAAGTADDVAIGDLLGIDSTDGLLTANSSYTRPQFTALEPVVDPTANYMIWCSFNG